MFSNASLEKEFQAEVVNLASYLVKMSPHRALDGQVPKRIWLGNAPNYSNLKVFICPSYARVNQGKPEPGVVKCIFLGFGVGIKGYKLWCQKRVRSSLVEMLNLMKNKLFF